MKLESKVDIKDKEKVDILKSLMESVRSQIMFWHDRAYIAATASFGILLTITKLWIDTLNKTIDIQHTQHVINGYQLKPKKELGVKDWLVVLLMSVGLQGVHPYSQQLGCRKVILLPQ